MPFGKVGTTLIRGNTRGVVAIMPDCDLIVSKFELKSRYYI